MAHCCVVNCHSSVKRKEPGVKFYVFPGRSYETELKRRWIVAINRKNPDGSIWEPTKRVSVCSKHFIGGKRNVTPSHPSSVPSIFLDVYKKTTTETARSRKTSRFERFMKRSGVVVCPIVVGPSQGTTCAPGQNRISSVYEQWCPSCFGLSSTAASLFKKTLQYLYCKTLNFIQWPDRFAVKETLPQSIGTLYPNARVIIDCTEIRCEQPKLVSDRVLMYSDYKGTYTAKVLVGVTPNGYISFLSHAYGGSASDTFIVNDSGFLRLLEPDDVVLAAKGFLGFRKAGDNAIIVIPPFVRDRKLTPDEVRKTLYEFMLRDAYDV